MAGKKNGKVEGKSKAPRRAKRVLRGKHPTQAEIPGTEVVVPQAVQERADVFVDLWDKRAKMRKPEADAREQLVEAMREADVEVFKFLDADGEEITITANKKTTLAVRRKARAVESEDA